MAVRTSAAPPTVASAPSSGTLTVRPFTVPVALASGDPVLPEPPGLVLLLPPPPHAAVSVASVAAADRQPRLQKARRDGSVGREMSVTVCETPGGGERLPDFAPASAGRPGPEPAARTLVYTVNVTVLLANVVG
ncbi:hypothetical protein TBR22_A02110 [Luteitalea sp. TBR-22]|nr:hypothetical protein TBR22_A02110 [Luteitalea sp. TBR-22]